MSAIVGINAEYPHWDVITTRWMDNDMYGHVNNVQYYSYFDTVVTSWLIGTAGLDPRHDPVIGLCIESQCNFHAPLTFPETVTAGLRVGHVGRSSVRYELALHAGDSETPAASGHFVHVYVDRVTRRPAPLPDSIRTALMALRAPTDGVHT